MLAVDIKTSLRQRYRQIRRQISSDQKKIASQSLVEIFLSHIDCEQKKIAVYLAFDGEIDLQDLIETLWKKKCFVFLPVIRPDSQQLCFVPYRASTVIKKNSYGIHEPGDITECILPAALDMVLMPVVAFNDHGVRLGMGKGYYDHSFSFCRYSHEKPLLMGVGYACQYCETLMADEWDVPLDGIMTERKLILLNERV